MAEYIARLNVALNRCSDVTDIEAKFLFEENLWAEVAVHVMNCQPLSLKDFQTESQSSRSIFKHSGIF